MTDLRNRPGVEINAQGMPVLIWKSYWAGAERAQFAGGSFLVIPNGTTWTARYDRNGKTEWAHPVIFNAADEAKAACARRRLAK